MEEFRLFFEDSNVQKVWHNYGFDRHVLQRLGFRMQGFGGDTLHMARLWDASRKGSETYALDSLSRDAKINAELAKTFKPEEVGLPKRGMKERFGLLRLKADGSPTKVDQVPPMHVLHTDALFRPEWVDYSALDAKATWNVHRALMSLLQQQLVVMDSYLCQQLLSAQQHNPQLHAALALAKEAEQPPPPAAAAALAAARGGAGPQRRPRPMMKSRVLTGQQQQQQVVQPGVQQQQQLSTLSSSSANYTLWDLYLEYWKPFGDVLTQMEQDGVRVNRDHLSVQEQVAIADQQEAEASFRRWAQKYVPGAVHMNVNSQVQIRQLLFPTYCETPSKKFKAANPNYNPEARPRTPRWLDFEIHGLWGLGQPGRLAVDTTTAKGLPAASSAVLWSLVGKPGAARAALKALDEKEAAERGESSSSSGSATEAEAALVSIHEDDADDGEMLGLDEDDSSGSSSNATNAAAAAAPEVQLVPGGDLSDGQLAALQAEAASMKLGKMYAAMGGGRAGIEACRALEQLIEVSLIDKLLTSFIQPLQHDNISTRWQQQDGQYVRSSAAASAAAADAADADTVDAAVPADDASGLVLANSSSSSSSSAELVSVVHRVHCSLNLNTETGRLSARRPNLQNQPAHEKDRYKVRKAFCAAPGNTLVVADYGQLELRLLAHMADCKSMLRAFELGGDFHSRTALGMYDYIQEAIDKGECLLEWDEAHEGRPPPVPLLKDKFGGERRKAKILNFSIAYGKTAHGLAKDWGTSLEEAEATVARWYADRPEVREWQAATRAYAARHGWVNTMIGRRRRLPEINSSDRRYKGRSERAAINTPIQGSAADVASAAMLSIVRDEALKEMGWKLLLQVHDEVMLEGPRESAEAAKARVVACMANPWHNLVGFEGQPLRVELAVDANTADTWYEAK
ncbi:hypothetical protein OEZ85_008750 [Tetradesmus obliquus]|uniref:DNA-directed DNA polymerase family A palm domain-containing protein n=1 Tax=Tetradesmus obliquus TaxID=3088 RepID=A0ABY8TJQ9_TETOB|nr:hypothetical protein OEZ85_008750 [Tetradesmus obliquus]